VGEECDAFRSMLCRDHLYLFGYVVKRLFPCSFAEALHAALFCAYQGFAQTVLVVVHAHSAGAARTETAVAVEVFTVPDNLLN